MQGRKKYYIDGGEIEVVKPVDNSTFCANCSRLRITPDGKIKPCLLRNDNLVELISHVRNGASEDELEEIFYMNCKKYDYKVEDDVKHQIRALITSRKMGSIENFANAREIRNLFEEIITNQAKRVSTLESPTNDDMMTICLDDLKDLTQLENKQDAD